jgi:hypothetical protein
MTIIETINPSASAERAKAVLETIRAVILEGTDRQAETYLNRLCPALTDREQTAVKRNLRENQYGGDPLEMLKEWAHDRLHPTDRPDSPLRPKRGSGGPTPLGREFWPGKRGGPVVSGGLAGRH